MGAEAVTPLPFNAMPGVRVTPSPLLPYRTDDGEIVHCLEVTNEDGTIDFVVSRELWDELRKKTGNGSNPTV